MYFTGKTTITFAETRGFQNRRVSFLLLVVAFSWHHAFAQTNAPQLASGAFLNAQHTQTVLQAGAPLWNLHYQGFLEIENIYNLQLSSRHSWRNWVAEVAAGYAQENIFHTLHLSGQVGIKLRPNLALLGRLEFERKSTKTIERFSILHSRYALGVEYYFSKHWAFASQSHLSSFGSWSHSLVVAKEIDNISTLYLRFHSTAHQRQIRTGIQISQPLITLFSEVALLRQEISVGVQIPFEHGVVAVYVSYNSPLGSQATTQFAFPRVKKL